MISITKKDYDIKKMIGEGAYGCVMEATEVKSGDRVAIKTLKNMNSPNQIIDLPYTSLREVSILQDLKHPNIVK
jgi:serine/threonine protein kinase